MHRLKGVCRVCQRRQVVVGGEKREVVLPLIERIKRHVGFHAYVKLRHRHELGADGGTTGRLQSMSMLEKALLVGECCRGRRRLS